MSKSTNTSTPILTPATVLDAYRAASDQKARNAVKKAAEGLRNAAIMAPEADVELIRAWSTAIDGLTVAKSTPAKAETDWQAVYQHRLDVINTALAIVKGSAPIDGFPEGWMPDESAIVHRVAEEGTDAYAEAAKFALARATRNGPTVKIQSVIDAAFEGATKGTFLTVAEICNKAGYAHDGAVAARLFPASGSACTLTGVTPTAATADRGRGATKA